MYCRYLREFKIEEDNQEDNLIYDLTQTAGSRFALVYTGTWVPQGEIIEGYKRWGRWWGRWDCRTLMSIRKFDADRNLHWHYTIPGVFRANSDLAERDSPTEPLDESVLQGFVSVKVASDGAVFALHNWADKDIEGIETQVRPELLKFDPYGNVLATVTLEKLREARQLDLDADDNVYVGGTWLLTSPNGLSRFNLQKYDSDLNLVKIVDDDDAPFPINHLIVKGDRIYCGTQSQGVVPGYSYTTYQNPVIWIYDLDLVQQSAIDMPGSTFSHVRGVAVDDDGNIYANGTFVNDSDTSTSYGTLQKFNSSGALQWFKSLGESTFPFYQPVHYRDDHIYVYAAIDQTLRKYTLDGVEVWSVPIVTWDDEDNDYSDLLPYMRSIDSDADGNLYLAGRHYEVSSIKLPLNVQKISPEGDVIWKYEIRRTQHDIAINQETGEFYTVGEVVEDDC
ncbi:hypothetical protein Enr17x_29110 [Gimesia fumaroli]|uniref:Uncharacterized protein n=2 Tax=Gimesia fumaroli TaxID=2527976 RepID=A0A518ICN4_9PLAN|nr:hypothetical protein Enr17x_29110 [Gimesia fumaroli]